MTAPTVPFYPITHDDGLSIVSALNGLVDVNDTPSLLADPFDEAISYAVGNYVIYAGALYRFTSAHSAGPWNSNHVTQVLVMGEVYKFINSFTSKKTINENDTISFDDLRQYGNGIFSIKVPTGSPVPYGTNQYWYVIQICFYQENEYTLQIATPSTGSNALYVRKYYNHTHSWTGWRSDSLLYFTGVGCSTNGTICRIPSSGSDARITGDTVVLNLTYSKPEAITSKVSWSSNDGGYITFTGTCTDATCTMNVILGQKGN